jgi:hypothetical protein
MPGFFRGLRAWFEPYGRAKVRLPKPRADACIEHGSADINILPGVQIIYFL